MKKLPLIIAFIFWNATNSQLTNANFSTAIYNCLSTNPVDGKCSSSPYGEMPDWDVSLVTNMRDAFTLESNFNADISQWDVSNVTDMYTMFSFATNFNQDLSSWNVGNVELMWGMFYYAENFNKDIDAWNVSNVLSMGYMFMGAASFNQNLPNWNVSNVIEMHQMFLNANNFNGDIGNWDVSSLTFGYSMFSGASSFNRDISNWKLTDLTYLYGMFSGASSFNQDISEWDVSNVTDMAALFSNSGLSTENYDNILNAWSQQNIQPNVQLGSHGIYFCNSEDARQSLINNKNWTINDEGINCTTANTDGHNKLVVSVYPNPTSDILYIEGNYNKLKIIFYDVLGKKIVEESITNKIDISHFQEGIYLLKLYDEEKVSTHRVIKN